MQAAAPTISTGTGLAIVEHGALRIELALRPFAFTVRRAGRRLLRDGGLWVAEGTIKDHFLQFTEGVVAREERAPGTTSMDFASTRSRSTRS